MNLEGVSTSIQSLLPTIRQRCGEIEQARRIPRDLADELRKTEIFSLGVPRAIGGRKQPLSISCGPSKPLPWPMAQPDGAP